jgi:transcriptional regulator with XRE-family HTH domain
MLTGEQIKAARALARIDQNELAKLADVSFETVKRLEQMRGEIRATVATEKALRQAFASVGVVFIDENGGGAGVRIREPSNQAGG